MTDKRIRIEPLPTDFTVLGSNVEHITLEEAKRRYPDVSC